MTILHVLALTPGDTPLALGCIQFVMALVSDAKFLNHWFIGTHIACFLCQEAGKMMCQSVSLLAYP